MRKVSIMVIACLLTFAVLAPCLLAEGSGTRGTKLQRGFLNIVTSWLEIPRQVKGVTEETDDAFAGITYGMAKGIALTGARIVAGAFDVVTFYFAPYDKPLMDTDFRI